MESEPVRRRIKLFLLSLVGLGVLLTVFCFFPEVDGQASKPIVVESRTNKPFQTWDTKPDLVIVFSGQMHGYMQACGCSWPQWGGLVRRYNFIQTLQKKRWPVVAIDLGEIAPERGSQKMLKYITSMNALDIMGYDAFGIGLNEFNMPTFQALANFGVSDSKFRTVATNLIGTEKPLQPFHDLGVRQYRLINRVNPSVGVYNLIDTKIQKLVTDKDDCKFLPPAESLANVMANMKVRPIVNVVIYQGTDDKLEAVEFVKKFDQIRKNKDVPLVPIMLCLSEQSEPPAPKRVNSTSIYSVGHKGRYIGVIGLFSQGPNQPYQSKFELVPIGPEYDTPPGKEKDNPVMGLLERYAQKVKDEDFIGKSTHVPHELQVQFPLKGGLKYVGSEVCAGCHHQKSFAVWKKTKHAIAFKKLEEAKNPGLRQFDSECIGCHTIGFKYQSGYGDKNALPGIDLTNVGCESCHGPGSAHVKEKGLNKEMNKAMNPYSTRADRIPKQDADNPALKAIYIAKKRQASNDACQKCHDTDNDVHWDFDKAWPKIAHPDIAAPNPIPNPNPNIGPGPGNPLAPNPGGINIEPGDKK